MAGWDLRVREEALMGGVGGSERGILEDGRGSLINLSLLSPQEFSPCQVQGGGSTGRKGKELKCLESTLSSVTFSNCLFRGTV